MVGNLLFHLFAIVALTRGGSISDSLRQKLEGGEKSDAILELPSVFGNVMSNPVLSFMSGAAKVNMLQSLQKQATSAAQAPFMSAISSLGLAESATPFWASNDIGLKGLDASALQSLGGLPGVFNLREPFTVNVNPVVRSTEEEVLDRDARQAAVQWGVSKIQAPAVWSAKTKGNGVVVAGIDTGVYKEHESLRDNYAGKWHDPVYGTSQPDDGHGHGTHTVGTMVGRTQGIGVAPDAQWIACRGLDDNGSGAESTLKACGQWVLEQNPDVVSNSWGGSQGQSWYNDIINNWRAAGIIPVFSIGNAGNRCKTANSPGDQLPGKLISVGSTKQDDTMSSFSSRGTSTAGSLKPEVSAPGDGITSAGINGPASYAKMSGTSMAAPHVAGAVALMLSANPSWKYEDVYKAFTSKSDQPATNDLSCGKPTSSSYPNNAYGYGRINVKKALGL